MPSNSMKKQSISFYSGPFARYLPAIIAALLYFTAVNHGFVLDDNLVITTNDHVQEGIAGIPDLFKYNYGHGHQGFNDGLYRPLSLATFALEKSMFDLSAPLSHLLQALLYGLCVLMLSLWLGKLFQSKLEWVFWIALLFAVHPIHTEVAANLKSRDEILALLFFLASAFYYVKWMQKSSNGDLTISAMLFIGALFSKESAVTFIVLFPLMAWFSEMNWRNIISSTLVMSIPVGCFLLVRFLVLNSIGPVDTGVSSLLQNTLIENDGLSARIATASAIQGLYLTKLFIPINLSHDYSFNAIPLTHLIDLAGIAWLTINLGLIGIGFYGLSKRKWWSFGVLFYYLTIAVVANLLILIGAMAAERFLFTPSLGWCITAVVLIFTFIKSNRIANVTMGSIVVIFALLTLNRIPDWKSNFTLFTADVEVVPNSARAHYNAGSVLIDEAKINPRMSSQYINDARAHLQESINIWPDYQDAYNNLGISYMNSNEFEKAYALFDKFIKKFPDYDKARYNMGVTCKKLQRASEAETHFEKFLIANPKNASALFELADVEGIQNKFPEAMEHLNMYNELEPRKEGGRLKLAMAYAITGNETKAESELIQAREINPKNVDVHTNLGLIYLNTNRLAEAKISFEKALEIDPNSERARNLLNQINP